MQQPSTQVAAWIQSMIDERDQALARNRDLEQWLSVARELINDQAKRNLQLTQRIQELEGK